jgi:hypothetical protein
MTDRNPSKSTLPLPDYDHLELGSLAARIRPLDAEAVGQLLAYERQHGNRLPAVQVLERRAEELSAGAAPAEASAQGASHEAAAASEGSPASPATQGPAVNPPSHGDPTNPAQPRT